MKLCKENFQIPITNFVLWIKILDIGGKTRKDNNQTIMS